jgi:hypothetical protein
MTDARLAERMAAYLDGALDEAGERELLALLQSAPPDARDAAARDAVAERLLRELPRPPLDPAVIVRAIPSGPGPSLRSRVMNRITSGATAQPGSGVVRRLRQAVAVAAAAVLFAAAVAAVVAIRSAPPPAYFLLANGRPVARGAAVTADARPVRVLLGGYCRIDLDPGASLRVEGQPWAEEIFLRHGRVACQVTPGRGAFVVRTEIGTVAVRGTAFEAALEDVEPVCDEAGPRLAVSVVEGAVALTGADGTRLVKAGEMAILTPPVAAGEFAPDAGGFIRHWLLLGPVPVAPHPVHQTETALKTFFDGLPVPAEAADRPRAGGRVDVNGVPFAWRPHTAAGSIVDLAVYARDVGASKDSALFLGMTYLVCEQEMTGLRLRIGADDSSMWRLNGREIVRFYSDSAVSPDQRTSVPLALQKGVNVLSFSVVNRDGPTGACARFVDAAGRPVLAYTVTRTSPAGSALALE